jgi:lysophospholipase L1-like esterase
MFIRLGLLDDTTTASPVVALQTAGEAGAIETCDPIVAAVEKEKPARRKRSRHILLSKPAQTILCLFIFASLPFFVPRLAKYRELLPDLNELVSFKGSETNAPTDVPGGAPSGADTMFASTGAGEPVVVGSEHPVEDPSRALDSFYAALTRTDAKQNGAVTRVTHYGDSPITNDGITSTVRRLMQTRFGDAGHGFILMDRPWAWYNHEAITFVANGWDNNPIMGANSFDGQFGLGGVSFRAGPGKYARFGPASQGETGKNFSRMDVYYLQQQNGGQFSVGIEGGNAQTVSTSGDAVRSAFYEFKASQSGENTFEVRTTGGYVKLFGAVLENEGPGVVYDSLGVNGAYAGLLATAMGEEHWKEQLQHRNPNLVVLNYGTNESQYASEDQMQRYEKDLREVIRRVQVALPGVSILIVSPMDRGQRGPGGKIITKPSIPLIVEMQRRVALDTGCAFFNTFTAMGGPGTMAKWHAGTGKNHYVGGDLTHPTAEGAEVVGRLIYEALTDGYIKYKARNVNQSPLVAQQNK